ncbi:MAG TPA: hypothetical protein VFX68_08300 [Sulfuricurvum sp.]|nr:hypothetical protein [Sulfuricurvum sp.]
MSTLSSKERHALEDVFSSISTSRSSFLKDKISYYHAYLILHLKARARELKYPSALLKRVKKASEITFLQKNLQKL